MIRSILLFVLIFIGQVSGQPIPLFETEVRILVLDDDLLYVVVQINNNSQRIVTELEGFLTELDPSVNIISEREIVHIHTYESPLKNGQTVIRGFTYPFDKVKDFRYGYHISHIKFRNDPRVFAYSPIVGLIRIE